MPSAEPNPVARDADALAGLSRLSAASHEVDGRTLCVVVGFDAAGCAVWTTTLSRSTDRERWWTHEPEEYDGA